MKSIKRAGLGILLMSLLVLAGCGGVYDVAGEWKSGDSEIGFDPIKKVCGLAIADELGTADQQLILCAGAYEVKDNVLVISVTKEATEAFYKDKVSAKITELMKKNIEETVKKLPYDKEQIEALIAMGGATPEVMQMMAMFSALEDEKALALLIEAQVTPVMEKYVAAKTVSFPYEKEGSALKLTLPNKKVLEFKK